MAKAKAKKAKKSTAKKQLKGKTSKPAYLAIAKGLPGKVPATVGEHFRARIVEGKLENEAILKEVKAKHKGCKATMSSLYWNRQYVQHHDGIALK
jgi:hypothetical protein